MTTYAMFFYFFCFMTHCTTLLFAWTERVLILYRLLFRFSPIFSELWNAPKKETTLKPRHLFCHILLLLMKSAPREKKKCRGDKNDKKEYLIEWEWERKRENVLPLSIKNELRAWLTTPVFSECPLSKSPLLADSLIMWFNLSLLIDFTCWPISISGCEPQ